MEFSWAIAQWVGTHFQKQISRTFLGLRLIFQDFKYHLKPFPFIPKICTSTLLTVQGGWWIWTLFGWGRDVKSFQWNKVKSSLFLYFSLLGGIKLSLIRDLLTNRESPLRCKSVVMSTAVPHRKKHTTIWRNLW